MLSVPRVRLEVTAAATTDGVVLADMIGRAVEFIQSQTRRYFGPVTETTEYLSGNGSRTLRLSEPAVITDSASEVNEVLERLYAGADPTTITDFEIREGANTSYLVRLDGSVWTFGYEYQVTYSRGYVVDEGPKDIEDMILGLIKVKLKFAGHEGMRSETAAGYSYTRFGDEDLDAVEGARDTIKAWRRLILV